MINNNDQQSLFNIIINAKNRVEFMKDRYIGNSFSMVFAEGIQNNTLEELGKSIRNSILSFDQD